MRLAIIPARGGSKRIPKKNIKDFCGRPIIAYSINAAIKSSLFDIVMVSTDSEEIASLAKEYGAEVPFLRSNRTSDDYATTSDVLEEVLVRYKDIGYTFDCFCCIYPTAPPVTATKLNEAFTLFEDKKAEAVLPVVKYSYPPQRAIVIKDGLASFQYIENRFARSQDLEAIYHDAGQFYFLRTEAFVKQHDLVLKKTIPLIVNELEVQDIDNETDWKLAETKYRMAVKTDG